MALHHYEKMLDSSVTPLRKMGRIMDWEWPENGNVVAIRVSVRSGAFIGPWRMNLRNNGSWMFADDNNFFLSGAAKFAEKTGLSIPVEKGKLGTLEWQSKATGSPTLPATIIFTIDDGALATSAEWGGIEGTLADQTDLQDALDLKASITYVDSLLAANDAMVYKGAVDCSANPNYPAASAGDTYRVSVAGKIGGGSGPNVEVGDILICNTDSTSLGNHATVGANWNIIQTNIDGAVTLAATQTLTNKRITARVGTTASSSTPTPDADAHDEYHVTALAADAAFAAPSGTPTDGQPLLIRIKDNGTARALSFNATYRAIGVDLPTTTTISKTMYVGAAYNSADSKWDVLAVAEEA